jgi:hypothetical protein
MTETGNLITLIQAGRIGDFKVEPDNVMALLGVELYEGGKTKPHQIQTRIDAGDLVITRLNLAFKGEANSTSFPLRDVTRVQPYETAIDIYQKGIKEPWKFGWGNRISMKCMGIPSDDGRVKPLAGWIVAQFIINERNRVGNLLKAK